MTCSKENTIAVAIIGAMAGAIVLCFYLGAYNFVEQPEFITRIGADELWVYACRVERHKADGAVDTVLSKKGGCSHE